MKDEEIAAVRIELEDFVEEVFASLPRRISGPRAACICGARCWTGGVSGCSRWASGSGSISSNYSSSSRPQPGVLGRIHRYFHSPRPAAAPASGLTVNKHYRDFCPPLSHKPHVTNRCFVQVQPSYLRMACPVRYPSFQVWPRRVHLSLRGSDGNNSETLSL